MRNNLIKKLMTLSFVSTVFLGLCSCEQEPVNVDVSDIDISMTSVSLYTGETVQLTAVVVPSNATDTDIEWVSVDPAVAKVDIYGLVTAVSQGETIVMARSGEIVKECEVIVSDVPAQGLSLDKSTLDLKVGDNAQLTAVISPENAGDVKIEWSSSNTKVVTVDNTGMLLAHASGEALITASAGELAASCRVYVMGDLQVGDYYYEDGRYFSVPIEGHTPVAIVFYVGDPSKDDAALRADHPECTHGLALALFGESSVVWQPNVAASGKLVSAWQKDDPEASKYIDVHQNSSGEYLNSIVGYSNTKVYELFNEDDANSEWPVEAVGLIQEFRQENPLPSNTSGWYIPSIKELSLMCTGEYDNNIGGMNENTLMQSPLNEMVAFLNEKIYKIPGAYLFSPNYYLSSTEGDIVSQMYWKTYNQWYVKMATGYVTHGDRASGGNAIRPVFAF